MNYIVPPVNLKGLFKFANPLDKKLKPNIQYKVIAVRAVPEMIKEGIDVKLVVFDYYGLSENDYNNVLDNNIPIIVLQDEADNIYYVPANFILNTPDITGVIYVGKAIIINLGYIPKKLNLTYLLNDLKEIIKSTVGVEPDVIEEQTSGEFVVSYKKHDEKERNRKMMITNNDTCYGRLFKLQEIYKSCKSKLQLLLDKYVKKDET